MDVEAIELVECHPVDHPLDVLRRLVVSRNVNVEATVGECRFILNGDRRNVCVETTIRGLVEQLR